MDEEQLRLNSLVAGLRGSVTSMQSAVTGQTTALASLSKINRDLTLEAKKLADVFTRKTDELKQSFDTLNNSIKNMAGVPGTPGGGAGAGGGQPPTGPSPTPDDSQEEPSRIAGAFDKVTDLFVDQLVQGVDLLFNSIKAQTVEFLDISDKLLSVGFSIDQFRASYAENNANLLASNTETNQRMLTLAGSVQDAARNTASLVDIGISPLSTDILNLAGRMGVLGQDVGKLMSVNEKLFTQGGMNSQELNGLAATLERSTIEQSVSTDKLISSLDNLSNALPALNLAGLSEEASQLTLELTKALPAGLKPLAGTLVSTLTTAEGAIQGAALGISDLGQLLKAGGPKAAAEQLIREVTGAGSYLGQLGESANNSVIAVDALNSMFGAAGQQILQVSQGFGKADEAGAQKQIEGLNESFENLKTEFMKPISEGIASFAEGFITQIPVVIDFIKENGEVLAELTTKALGFFQQMVFGILEYLPTIIRTVGTISGALLPFIALKSVDAVGRSIQFGIDRSNLLLQQIVAQLRINSAKQTASSAASTVGGMAGLAGRALGFLTGPVGMIALSVGGALLGEALSSKVSSPLEDISSKIGKLDITQERQLQVAEEESVQRRLNAQREYQREQASEFDTFLKNFMARNIDEMAMSRNAQNTVMGILVDRVEELTEVTRGTGREMGEVVEAGRAAEALRTEVEPQ